MSDMNMMNSIRPSTLPRITPASTSNHCENLLLDLTLCFLPVKYWAIRDVSNLGRSLFNFVSMIR